MKNVGEAHLANYRALVARVDALCRRIEADCRDLLACRRGCDACCRHLTVFRVEAVALALALTALPAQTAGRVRKRARRATPERGAVRSLRTAPACSTRPAP